ncbi:MAG: ORF6N domain protein [Verrucomicrobia bacterium ADurb.Bin070]|nr:MAG: ORF6N domain protein [Verrucomicrobia bacterium ADurb.Bin070]
MSDTVIPVERIEQAIYLIRGQKVMLDRDLAMLYDVETRALNQAVTRNIRRFPADFIFELTREEILRISQTVTSSSDLKFSKSVRAFTEQGVAMLSTVLRSDRAIAVNIAIMRTFVKLRQMLDSHAKLAKKLAGLEAKYDEQFRAVFEVLNELMAAPAPKRKPIGFSVKERRARYSVRKS